ncbi:putative sterol glucosyltransferase [Fusarium austroafricanum]|uniref:Putative sterol glucosyltransferase n=1 Tax=Fusarium austroafricanum TaxID=2364996 RepID=A0A8H4NY14_9HYPO|nr:putative sterol glucosyltransferase [Fusarium austroafricanum]
MDPQEEDLNKLKLEVSEQHNNNEDRKQSTTLITDTHGDVAYPAPVPRPIQSPESPLSPRTPKENIEPGEDSKQMQPQLKSASVPGRGDPISPKATPTHKHRPRPTKSWQTEQPRRDHHRHSYFRPGPARAGTSYLNKAIWEGPEKPRRSSSDSSVALPEPGKNEQQINQKESHGSRHWKKGSEKAKDDEDKYGHFSVGNQNYQTSGKVKKDGRLRITVNETAGTGYLTKALGAAVNKVTPAKAENAGTVSNLQIPESPRRSSSSTAVADPVPRTRLNIVIMVIGSRGDAQPFLKIGKVLKEDYGHRVRIATHPAFREFVEKDSGLDFFSVGGDPSELMAFMVKNPGLIPTLETVKAGDIGRRRAAMATMFDGFWRACVNATDDETDRQNLKMMGEKDPFVADVIIANPPSFAHIHCAEALGIPVHLMFTFPYTPTQAFPHPLASIKNSNVDPGYTNFISYPLVEMMVWQGLGDLVNEFRVKTLALDPVSTLWAPGATYRLHVPFTYLWSPGLVPKPQDWGSEIDVAGFVFLDLASTFEPPKELEDFLAAGETPIYIGFGSIVVDDADKFTQMIFEAVELAGVRALVSKGWGGLGGDDVPNNIFMLDNTPHDWLFPRVKACVIHGGAGTTAIALKCGKPTMIVPFFGDQNFWGKMVSNANVGPEPIPYKYLNAEKLAEGIKFCLTDEAREAAGEIAKRIAEEGDGAANAVKEFHRQLNLKTPSIMRCSLFQDHTAVWELKNTNIKLGALAADILVDNGLLTWKRLRLLRHMEWNDFEGPGEPVTGIAGSIASTVGEAFHGVASVPYHWAKRTRSISKKKSKRNAKKSKKTDNNHMTRHSPARSNDPVDAASLRTETTTENTGGQYVGDIASGVERTATAIAKAPVDLSMALAQGFHNAPRLYGDNTVRRPIRVTGFHSGLRAARHEFAYGVYDGFTGVVRLPVRGAKENGPIGFAKGTGMGLTGLVLKNLSALVGPVGYTLKGVVKQAERSKTPQKYIRRARIVQGQREYKALPEDQRKQLEREVIEGWHIMKELREKVEDLEKQRGIAGQIDRVFLDTEVIFEDVDVAKRSLKALKQGKTLENVVDPDRERGRDGGKSDRNRSVSIRRSFNLTKKSRGEKYASDAEESTKKGQRDERPPEMYRLTVPAR